MALYYSDPNNKQHVSSILQKCQDDPRCTAHKKIKPGLHLDIVVTVAEHACDHVLKRVLRLSAYRFQIFLLKYEYLRSLQLLTKAYVESLKNMLAILTTAMETRLLKDTQNVCNS